MPYMYELPAFDIYFLPNGQIIQMDISLWAYQGENEKEQIVSQFNFESNAEMGITDTDTPIRFEVIPIEKWQNKPLLKPSYGNDVFDYAQFPAFMRWATEFDFESILKDYVYEQPVFYELIAGAQIQRALIEGGEMNGKYLDLSSGEPVEISYEDLPYSPPEIFPFSPAMEVDDYRKDLEYYVILPHYHAEEKTGYNPLFVCTPDFDCENDFSFYSSEAKALKYENYVINNFIIIFPYGTGK